MEVGSMVPCTGRPALGSIVPCLVLLTVLTLGLPSGPLTVEAQPTKKALRIGLIESGTPATRGERVEAFRQALRELGWVEGRNVAIEIRWAEGRTDRFQEFAEDLVRLQVDVIVVSAGEPAIAAAQKATHSIPIVMTSVGDPVGRGFVASLARPGGNITGVSNQAVELTGKWIELLKETLPKVSKVAVLRNPDNPSHAFFLREAERAAQSLGIRVYSADFRRPEELESTFAAIGKELAEAIVVLPDPMTGANRARIIDLATQKRLASIAAFTEFPRGGALMSYGPSLIGNVRRAAVYVDKILKGANPAGLPVEQPTKFEMCINLKPARALGLTIPPAVLRRADEVID